jgi:SAM-dependent methyltransferase
VSARPIDPAAFREFEHAGWQAIPEGYRDAFEALTLQAAGSLLDAAGVREGVRVLDVATGPGSVAAAARRRGALVLGLDFSPAMVALARRLHPDLEFREGDAEALPFPDRSFDAVVNNFGMLHLGRPERALAEAHRVLRPGGRVGFTVWAPPDAAVAFGIVLDAIGRHGRLDAPIPPGPPFFRFSDPAECRRALRGAGFADPDVARVAQVWRFPSLDALMDVMEGSTVRTAALLRAQAPAARDAIRREVREAVRAYQRGEGVELPMPAVLASAARPA